MKKLLVTGAQGFVGKNAMKNLPNAIAMDRSKSSFKNIESMAGTFEECDSILHLAGINAGTSSQPDPVRMTQDNLDATYQLIQGVRRYCKARPRVVLLSSIHVYGPGHSILTEETDVAPNNVYGTMKYTQELLLKQAALAGTLELVIFRSTHIYGPESRPFYNSAVATLCHNAISNKPVDLYGNGNATLDLVFVEDVIEYVRRALSAKLSSPAEIFNLASGRVIAIADIVNHIESILGHSLSRRLIESPVNRTVIDRSRLINSLGNLELTSLKTGLARQLHALKTNF